MILQRQSAKINKRSQMNTTSSSSSLKSIAKEKRNLSKTDHFQYWLIYLHTFDLFIEKILKRSLSKKIINLDPLKKKFFSMITHWIEQGQVKCFLRSSNIDTYSTFLFTRFLCVCSIVGRRQCSLSIVLQFAILSTDVPCVSLSILFIGIVKQDRLSYLFKFIFFVCDNNRFLLNFDLWWWNQVHDRQINSNNGCWHIW